MKFSLQSKVLSLESNSTTCNTDSRLKSQESRLSGNACAFTLLEVIIACAIFFMVAFAVLGVVTQGLSAARSLQQREPDPGILAAAFSLTNQLVEGSDSGDFEDLYPGLYRGYTWAREVYEVSSNSLFQVDFYVYKDAGKKGASETKMSILMFRPGSPPGAATKGR
jgi:Tfp pilus assembly protein PilV